MSYVTVTEVRQYLDQVKITADKDDTIAAIVERAEGIVNDALGFAFFDAAVTWADTSATQKYVQGEVSKYLKLPAYKAGSITAVAVVTGTGTDATVSDTAITDYDEQAKCYLYRAAGWQGLRWAVTAKYGYGPAPASICELVLELTVNTWRQRAQGLFQTVSGVTDVGNAVGGGMIKYVGGLNADQRRIIQNVRRQYLDMVH